MASVIHHLRITRFPWQLYLLFVINICIKLPGLRLELPPFTFCDENLWRVSTLIALQENSPVLNEFRAGSVNTYPVLVLAEFWKIIFQSVSDTQVVLIGRFSLTILLGSLSIFYVYGSAKILTESKRAALISGFLFTISPYSYAMSQYWYPDHFIYFFSAGFLYYLLKVFHTPADNKSWKMLAVMFSLAVSTKYTAMILVASVIFLAFIQNRLQRKFEGEFWRKNYFRLLLSFLILSMLIIVLINFSALFNPQSFIWAMENTQSNYSRNGINTKGILFYLVIFLHMPLPYIGFVLIILGILVLLKKDAILVTMLLVPVIGLILFLGSSVLVINRNMSIFIPLIFIFSAIGLERVLSVVEKELTYHLKIKFTLSAFVVLIFCLTPAIQTSSAILADLRPDSRILAREWISRNIPLGTTVGSNDLCSAPSTADPNAYSIVKDGLFEERLDYYVIDSFFKPSIFDDVYRSKGILQQPLQKLHHYYFGFYDYDVFRLSKGSISAEKIATKNGYKIIARFMGAGPEILILKKLPSSS